MRRRRSKIASPVVSSRIAVARPACHRRSPDDRTARSRRVWVGREGSVSVESTWKLYPRPRRLEDDPDVQGRHGAAERERVRVLQPRRGERVLRVPMERHGLHERVHLVVDDDVAHALNLRPVRRSLPLLTFAIFPERSQRLDDPLALTPAESVKAEILRRPEHSWRRCSSASERGADREHDPLAPAGVTEPIHRSPTSPAVQASS